MDVDYDLELMKIADEFSYSALFLTAGLFLF